MRHFISLGHNCAVRSFLGKYRFALTPYEGWYGVDGLISRNLSGLCKLLMHSKIFETNNIEVIGQRTFFGKHYQDVLDKTTEFRSIHDFPIDQEVTKYLKKFHNKLKIEQFVHEVQYSEDPVFIRTNNPSEDFESILNLYDTISMLRAKKDSNL